MIRVATDAIIIRFFAKKTDRSVPWTIQMIPRRAAYGKSMKNSIHKKKCSRSSFFTPSSAENTPTTDG
jgi:hypothetical protein